MIFEQRELVPQADAVSPAELKIGGTYFRLEHLDDEQLLPALSPLKFLGRGLEGNPGAFYFQDASAHQRGIRFDSGLSDVQTGIHRFAEEALSSVYLYERALEELMKCSLRRKRAGEATAISAEKKSTPKPASHFFRFDNEVLQARLVERLIASSVVHGQDARGATFIEADTEAVLAAARHVRDKLFPWYPRFLGSASDEIVERYSNALNDAAFAFVVEHDCSGVRFILPRAYRALHETVWKKVAAASNDSIRAVESAQRAPRIAEIKDPLFKDVVRMQRNGQETQAQVVVGKPVPVSSDSSQEWCCPIEIQDERGADVISLYGMGAIESLANALGAVKRLQKY